MEQPVRWGLIAFILGVLGAALPVAFGYGTLNERLKAHAEYSQERSDMNNAAFQEMKIELHGLQNRVYRLELQIQRLLDRMRVQDLPGEPER